VIGEDGGQLREDYQPFMRSALNLAMRMLGQTWPNPAVGCILLRNGVPVGRGWTQPGGRPHAETQALAQAGELAREGTVVVTLEPCAHHGETPPCVDALLHAGVRRAVVAIEDPDPRVAGRGIAALRSAGVEVATGVCAREAAHLNQGFFLRTIHQRPLFTLKVASTLDGRIATVAGASRWITGEMARALAHHLRSTHDAILIGSETALADDPDLTCRLPGMARRSPVRVVADGRGRVSARSRLIETASDIPTWIVSGAQSALHARRSLPAAVRLLAVDRGSDGLLDPGAIARSLAEQGVTRVLLEGGGVLAASFLKAGLVDRVVWFRAPKIIGADGRPAIATAGVRELTDAFPFRRESVYQVGQDLVETFERVD
jgi:diaminohydroxyphosphoribosylaminopyrimidine deaminase (EC 3.5.4.26)/5-amino-6-(5-phosphoribosylamino)uracil reductase (EC 1.1.1.193)